MSFLSSFSNAAVFVTAILTNAHSFARAARRVVLVLLFGSFLLLAFSSVSVQAQTEKSPVDKATAKPSGNAERRAADQDAPPPLPADAHVPQSMQLDGKTLHYTATVGSLPVREKKGKVSGEVVFTAYTVDAPNRPVTFVFNGGPGSASVFLNFGGLGPKHLEFGNDGDGPSNPPTLTDNQGTWLDFTDLVFLDPIGTGFSRSLVSEEETKKQFYNTASDIEYLSRVIYDWLVKNGRLTSRKYLVGESYGGFRTPLVTSYLQSSLGIGLNGGVLVSSCLDPTFYDNGNATPIPWILTLPSITAAHLEREHRLTPEAMQPVIDYARGDYAAALLKGRSDPAATQAMIQRVTEMTGLDPDFVKRSGGRLEERAYLREVFREEGKVGSVYDSNFTSFDPFPYSAVPRSQDPLVGEHAPVTTAMVDFVTRVVGWKVDAHYEAVSDEVDRQWDFGDFLRKGSAAKLREALALDPKLHALIANGWTDLSCPFIGEILSVDQMLVMGDPTRVAVRQYPGGHMFYTRDASRLAFHNDVKAMYDTR